MKDVNCCELGTIVKDVVFVTFGKELKIETNKNNKSDHSHTHTHIRMGRRKQYCPQRTGLGEDEPNGKKTKKIARS